MNHVRLAVELFERGLGFGQGRTGVVNLMLRGLTRLIALGARNTRVGGDRQFRQFQRQVMSVLGVA